MSRRAILSVPTLDSTLVLDGETCRLGANSAVRRRQELQAHAEAEARAHEEAERAQQAQMNQLATLAQALANAADELAQKREALLEHLKEQSVRLALAVAAKLLIKETETNEQFALEAVHEALENTLHSDVIRIRLNPADRTVLAEAIQEELGSDRVEIVPDATVGPGGCELDTHFGTIDSTIDTRWTNMVKALSEDVNPQTAPDDAAAVVHENDPVDEVLL